MGCLVGFLRPELGRRLWGRSLSPKTCFPSGIPGCCVIHLDAMVSTSPCTGLGLLRSQQLRVPAHLTPLSHLLYPRRSPPAPPAALSKPPLMCPYFCLQLIKCPFYPQPSPLSWSQLALHPVVSRPCKLWVPGPLDLAPALWAWPPVYPSGTHTQPGSREGRGGAAIAVLLHCQPVALSETLAVSSFPPPLLHCPLPGGDHILLLLPQPGT